MFQYLKLVSIVPFLLLITFCSESETPLNAPLSSSATIQSSVVENISSNPAASTSSSLTLNTSISSSTLLTLSSSSTLLPSSSLPLTSSTIHQSSPMSSAHLSSSTQTSSTIELSSNETQRELTIYRDAQEGSPEFQQIGTQIFWGNWTVEMSNDVTEGDSSMALTLPGGGMIFLYDTLQDLSHLTGASLCFDIKAFADVAIKVEWQDTLYAFAFLKNYAELNLTWEHVVIPLDSFENIDLSAINTLFGIHNASNKVLIDNIYISRKETSTFIPGSTSLDTAYTAITEDPYYILTDDFNGTSAFQNIGVPFTSGYQDLHYSSDAPPLTSQSISVLTDNANFGLKFHSLKDLSYFTEGFLIFDLKATKSAQIRIGYNDYYSGHVSIRKMQYFLYDYAILNGEWETVYLPLSDTINIDLDSAIIPFEIENGYGSALIANIRYSLNGTSTKMDGSRPGSAAILGIPQSEYDALMDFYTSLGGAEVFGSQWGTNKRGPSGEALWYGLTIEGGHVTQLYVSSTVVDGSIPESIGNLTHLRQLGFVAYTPDPQKGLTLPLPNALSQLDSLKYVTFKNQNLTGSIPTILFSIPNLDQLDLSDNNLTGSIPSEISNAPGLGRLVLSNNNLSGTIPAEIGDLTLYDLHLNDNNLVGPLPTEMGHITTLQRLELNTLDISGPIPSFIYTLTDLRTLYLSYTNITMPLSSAIANLNELGILSITGNNLTGALPSEITQLTGLSRLYISDGNNFCAEDFTAEVLLYVQAKANDASFPQSCVP